MTEPSPYGEGVFQQQYNSGTPDSARRGFATRVLDRQALAYWDKLDAAGRKKWLHALKYRDEPEIVDRQRRAFPPTFAQLQLNELGILDKDGKKRTDEEYNATQEELRVVMEELKNDALDLWMTREDRPQPINATEMVNGVTYLGNFDIRSDDYARRGQTVQTRLREEPPFFRKVTVSKLRRLPQANLVEFTDTNTGHRIRIPPTGFTIYDFDKYTENNKRRRKNEIFIALQGTPVDKEKSKVGLLPPELAGIIARDYVVGKGRRTRRAKSMRRKRTVSRKRK